MFIRILNLGAYLQLFAIFPLLQILLHQKAERPESQNYLLLLIN